MAGIPAGQIEWGIRIEGLGDNDGALYRLASAVPIWDVDSVYRDVLQLPLPYLAMAVDFFGGGTSGEGMTLKLLDTAEVFGWLARLRPRPGAQLLAPLAPGDNSVTLDVTTLAGDPVWIQREVIVLGTHAGAGVYDNCLRGQAGTTAAAHDLAIDAEVFLDPVFLDGRRVTLFFYAADAEDYDDEVDLWTFTLRDWELNGTTWLLHLGGILDLMREAALLPQQWVGEVVAVPEATREGIAPSELQLTVRARVLPGQTAPAWPMAMTAWGVTSPETGATALVEFHEAVFEVELIDGDAETPSFRFNAATPLYGEPVAFDDLDDARRGGSFVREVFVSGVGALAEAGTDAVSVALVLMTSTAHGGNGDYDSGIDFGLRLPVGFLDIEGMEAARQLDVAGLEATRLFVAMGRESEEDDPPSALEVIEDRLLHPFALVFSRSVRTGASGRLTLRRWGQGEVSGEVLPSFDDDSITAIPTVAAGANRKLDAVRWEYNAWADDSRLRLDTNAVTAQGRSTGRRSNTGIDGGAVASLLVAYNAALEFLQRWDQAIPPVAWEADLLYDAPPGTTVLLTSTEGFSVDANGAPARGMEDALILITEQRLDAQRGVWGYRGLYIGLDYDRRGRIAPAALIEGESSGVLTVTAQHFCGPDHPTLASDAEAFEADDVCLIVDEYGVVKTTAIVQGVGGPTSIEVSLGGAYTWASGDELIVADYDDQTPSQQARWASIADSGGKLGAADDNGYQYE